MRISIKSRETEGRKKSELGQLERRIAPPGQEGWREAPGWLFKSISWNHHPVCAALVASRLFLVAQPPLLARRGNTSLGLVWAFAAITQVIRRCAVVFVLLMVVSSCTQPMANQPKYGPLQPSSFFSDGRSARPIPSGTVARGQLNDDEIFYTGKSNGEPVTMLPIPVTRKLLERGRDRFSIYCSPCHGDTGDGQGIVVLRGFRRGPPSYHIDRLREAPVGYFFDVVTNGFGGMQDYAAQIPPRDRWAIVAYIRALQFSQNAAIDDVPPAERSGLERQQ